MIELSIATAHMHNNSSFSIYNNNFVYSVVTENNFTCLLLIFLKMTMIAV